MSMETPGRDSHELASVTSAKLFESLYSASAIDEMVRMDLQFARFLVDKKLALPSQVQACLDEQRIAVEAGQRPVPPLEQLLIQKELLSPGQAAQAWESWESRPVELTANDANKVGPYECLEKIGSGGMGEVWKAWDTILDRPVALKFLKAADPNELSRFRREAELAAKLVHPNIAAIHQMDASGPRPYLAMQFIEGSTLDHIPNQDMRLLARLFRDAARALDHAHKQGIIHRDIKPSNIMVSCEKSMDLHVFLLDFGIARPVDGGGRVTTTGYLLGTPAYMSPEQARGDQADPRSDVYGLGATMYEVLTGQPTFSAGNVLELLKKVESEAPRGLRQLNRRIEVDLEKIVLKCLEKESSRRYASADALADDLDRFLQREPIHARTPSLAYKFRKRLAKRKALVVMASLAIVLAGAAALFRSRAASAETQALSELRRQTQTALLAVLEIRRAGRTERLKPFVERTEEACREAIALLPRSAEPHYRFGRVLRAVMDDVRALEEQNRALQKEPHFKPALYERSVLGARHFRRRSQELWKSAVAAEGKSRADRGDLKPGMTAPLPDWWTAAQADSEIMKILNQLTADLESLQVGGEGLSEGERQCALGLLSWARRADTEAIEHLSSALESAPDLEEGYEALAMLHEDKLDYEEAIHTWTRGYERDRGYVPYLLGRSSTQMNWGLHKRKKGEDPSTLYQGSIRDSTEALERRDDANAWGWRAAARINLGSYVESRGEDPTGHYEAGIGDYDKALARNPSKVELWLNRGLAQLHQSGRAGEPVPLYKAAMRDFDEALKRDGQRVEAWRGRGLAHSNWAKHSASRGEDPTALYTQSIQDYDRALECNPGSAESWTGRGHARSVAGLFVMGQGKDPTPFLEKAIEDFSEAVQRQPADTESWIGRGGAQVNWALYKASKGQDPTSLYEQAIADFGEALKHNPESFRAWQWRGRCRSNFANFIRAQGGDPSAVFTEALEDFNQAEKRNPADTESAFLRGGMRVNHAVFLAARGEDPSGAYGLALQDFDRALTLNPNQPQLWHFRGNAFLNRARFKATKELDVEADYRDALKCYEEAVRLNRHFESRLRPLLEECRRNIKQ